MRRAVLDLGSTSFHLLVAEVEHRHVWPLVRDRERLHLGAELARAGTLSTALADRAVAAAGRLARLARRHGAEAPLVVATDALRGEDADRADTGVLLARLEDAVGVPIRVLRGTEEAELATIGVRSAVQIDTEPLVVLDLGGGSLELSVGGPDTAPATASLPLGAGRLATAVASDPPASDELEQLTSRIDDELAPAVADLLAPTGGGHGEVVAVGGDVRALARTAARARGAWVPPGTTGVPLPREDLRGLADRLLRLDASGRQALPGVPASRSQELHVAALVLERALTHLAAAGCTVTSHGLREGVLLQSDGSPPATGSTDLRQASIRALRHRFRDDDPHPARVAALALRLFDRTQAIHDLDGTDRWRLYAAGELHHLGSVVAERRQHRHGARLLAHLAPPGLEADDVAVLVTVLASLTSADPRTDLPGGVRLSARDHRRAGILLGLLQLADVLDELGAEPAELEIEVRDDQLLIGSGSSASPDDDHLAARTPALGTALGRPVALLRSRG